MDEEGYRAGHEDVIMAASGGSGRAVGIVAEGIHLVDGAAVALDILIVAQGADEVGDDGGLGGAVGVEAVVAAGAHI